MVPGASLPLAAVPSWVHGAGGVLERGCAARWRGGERKPGGCCSALLFFSSPPLLLFFLQVLVAVTPGRGEAGAAETNGCCQAAGLGWEERAASQPALCYTGGLQGCCCLVMHSTGRGCLGEVSVSGRKGALPCIWLSAPDKRVLPLPLQPRLTTAWLQLTGTSKTEPEFGPERILG